MLLVQQRNIYYFLEIVSLGVQDEAFVFRAVENQSCALALSPFLSLSF